ncbi:MAG: nucleoside phosphorylase [Candidatus Nanoarchaeia archaeon]|nr:nucleoside phosphorylase [Candidatus Nanoarchaeia archaeon]
MIQPHLRVEKVCKYCILVGDPGRVIRVSKFLKDAKEMSNNRGLPVYEGSYEGIKISVVCAGMGGPSMAIVAEELINAGAKILIRIGSGAGLKKEMRTGYSVISTGIYKEEAATTAYVPANYPSIPDFEVLTALIESAKESNINYFYGPTICCDGLYSKKHWETMDYWSDYGLIGSEMEGSMLFTIALMRGVKAGMIFHVGINPKIKETFKDVISQEKARLKGEEKNIMIALEAIKKLSKEVKK